MFFESFKPGLVVATALSVAGCSDTVMRVVTLEPEGSMHASTAEEHDAALRVDFESVEPLAGDHRHVAWASTPTAFVALGEVGAKEPLMVPLADVGLTEGETEEVLVTVEEGGDTLPGSPSGVIAARGPVGGTLSVEAGYAAAVMMASGTATLEDEHVDVHTEGLPHVVLPYFYGVWVVFGEVGAHGHDEAPTSADEGHTHQALMVEGDEAWFAGRLSGGELHAKYESLTATASEVIVTLEYDEGPDEISEVTILHGAVEVPHASGSESGAHMH